MRHQSEENRIIDILAEQLSRGEDFKVHPRINLASRRFSKHWEKWWPGYLVPPAQPDIDLLLVNRKRQLLGIEVKYLKFENGRFKQSYYTGIEQGLGLLMFGFFYVALWHCFKEDAPLDKICQYERNTEDLIRALALPLNFSAVRIIEIDKEVQIKEISFEFSKEIARIPSPYGKENPLRTTDKGKKATEFIRMVLRIPESEPSVEEKIKGIRI